MKILLTGGAGFIGSHIADYYIGAGHDVTIIDDLSTGDQKNVAPGARFFKMSLLDASLADLVAEIQPDFVNHHAAQMDVGKSIENPVFDARVNIIGTLNLLEAVRGRGVKKIVFASTGGAVYGEQDNFPADESHRTDPCNPYGISKLSVEKYIQFYSWTYGIPFVVFRYANVYGPRQNAQGEAGVVAIFTTKLLRGERPIIYGDGKQTRDYVYVDDVVACNLEALKLDVQGVFNVGTGIETNVNTIARELMNLTEVDLLPEYAPTRPGEQKRSCLKPGVLQIRSPITIKNGLKKTVEWFKNKSREAPVAR